VSPEDVELVLVGHGLGADLEQCELLGVVLPPDLQTMDTQHLAWAAFSPAAAGESLAGVAAGNAHQVSLQKLLQQLGIKGQRLHNAGEAAAGAKGKDQWACGTDVVLSAADAGPGCVIRRRLLLRTQHLGMWSPDCRM
jgi:hypothetical protein